MGLGDFFGSLFGGKKKKKFELPDVTFIDDDSYDVTHTMPISPMHQKKQQIIVKYEGEYMVFDSKDDIPEDVQEELKHLDDLGTVDSYSVIVNGARKVYSSYEEIPQEIREAIKSSESK